MSTQMSCACVYVCVCAGIEKLRFKPAYNPYTEPSMEVFSYHDGEDELVDKTDGGWGWCGQD